MRPLSLVAVALSMVSQAQNLVPNGDFEEYSQCPDYVSQIDRAVGWQRPTDGTSDYFNACLASPFSMSVPGNQMGDQTAHSGNGYAGFYAIYANDTITVPSDNEREYVTHALVTPLIPGVTYSVEFHVSLADVSKYAVGELGALLSTGVPNRSDELPIDRTPQIVSDGTWLNAKEGWERISGCFVADSAYAYITIGNFNNGVNTAFMEVPTDFPLTYFSYYYVDDVSIGTIERPELGPDVESCGAVTLAVLNPILDAQYSWNTGASSPSITADESGMFIVTRTDLGCALTDTVTVTRLHTLALEMPTSVSTDLCANILELNTGPLPHGAQVLWSTGETTRAIQIHEAGSYTMTVEAPGSCASSWVIDVQDLCNTTPYAPTAFTPDGDGINDSWSPVWSAAPEADLYFTVFDRWGRVVMTGDRKSGWDGQLNGRDAPMGFYTYRLSASDAGTGQPSDHYGSFVLVR